MAKPKERPKYWKDFKATIDDKDWQDDWRPPFKVFQWGCEWASYWLSRVALLEVLEYVGKLGILFAVIVYIYPGCDERKQAAEDSKKSKHYVAWETLNSAVGKPGNAGRADALMDLNNDGVSLEGLDISAGSFASNLVLTNADLKYSNLSSSKIWDSDFSHSDMSFGILTNADCFRVKFANTDLSKADLTDTKFIGCDFASARLTTEQCSNTTFKYCNFANAEMELNGKATYFGCNFANCYYSDNTRGTFDSSTRWRLKNCNVYTIGPLVGSFVDSSFLQWVTNGVFAVSIPITNHVAWLDYLQTNWFRLSSFDQYDNLELLAANHLRNVPTQKANKK